MNYSIFPPQYLSSCLSQTTCTNLLRSIFFWLILSLVYLVAFPRQVWPRSQTFGMVAYLYFSILDVCSGYEPSYITNIVWPNGTIDVVTQEMQNCKLAFTLVELEHTLCCKDVEEVSQLNNLERGYLRLASRPNRNDYQSTRYMSRPARPGKPIKFHCSVRERYFPVPRKWTRTGNIILGWSISQWDVLGTVLQESSIVGRSFHLGWMGILAKYGYKLQMYTREWDLSGKSPSKQFGVKVLTTSSGDFQHNGSW